MSGDIGRDAIDPMLARLIALGEAERATVVRSLSRPMRREFNERWEAWAHRGQEAPEGDWRVWLIRAGRGFGKTRAGAEWISEVARTTPEARIALVGGTVDDVHKVMIEGASGLCAVARSDERIDWRASTGELVFPTGARAFVYSAESPEKLRGPQHNAAWCDELAKWRHGDRTWDNLMLGLRMGDAPRVLVTTTPRPSNLMRRVMTMAGPNESRGKTRDNPHLPDSFVADVEALYGGTRLGRQELDGELIEEIAGALWTREVIERGRVGEAPELMRTVIGVDPPASATGDACGIVAVALGRDGQGYVIEDASVSGLSPEGWARVVAACAARHGADRIIAEKNQGGDMVRSVLVAADAGLPVTAVHAAKAKAVRAEPVSTLYHSDRVHHVGAFPHLEDELCGLVAGGGYEGPGRSPDRADALVWALAELMLGARGEASIRGL